MTFSARQAADSQQGVRVRVAALICTGLLLADTLSATALGQVYPQPSDPPSAISTATNGLSCASARAGTQFNCTANEFTALINFGAPAGSPTECDAGGTITTSIIADLSGTNTYRYDGGIFVGQSGNDPGAFPSTGTCSVAVFPNATDILIPAPPRTRPLGFTDGVGGFETPDACGNYFAGGTERWQINNVQLQCNATGSGRLGVPYLLTYQQVNPGVCNGPSSPLLYPGTKAKCNSGIIPMTSVAVNGWVDITKATVPTSSTQTFSFTASGSGGTPTPSTFTLGNGQTQRVRIPLAGNVPVTLTITEEAIPGWVSTAQITCTAADGSANPSWVTTDNANRRIVASLTNTEPSARCTITNTKLTRVRTAKVVSPTTDPGTFNLSVAGTSGTSAVNATATAVGNGGATPWLTVNPASSATFSESVGAPPPPLGAYDSSYSCVNNDTNAVVSTGTGTSVTVSSVPSYADTTCTFTNARRRADLSVVKTASPAPPTGVVTGGSIDYTITVRNAGPSSATGAIITDVPNSALNCLGTTVVGCTSTATACSTGPYTVSQLLGAGITLGTLTANSTATLTFYCNTQ